MCLHKSRNGSIEWHKALIRIIAISILIYPATYAARESSKHRKIANHNRRLELELAAINPFIENLMDDKKHDIKEKLVDKYFGNASKDTDAGEEISINAIERIFKLTLQAFNAKK